MMDVFGSYFGKLGKKSVIDNITFRLHYKVTFAILCCCSMLTTLHSYIGNAIMCMGSGGVPGGKDLIQCTMAECGNLRIFLSFRFYVKSILDDNLDLFFAILVALNFLNW